jgi:antitoxin (DNA-binding transcriptional repressor) of toxin-antitoxin stability system
VHRNAKRVVRSAQNGRLPVTITDHGEPIAEVRPQYPRRVVSLAEFQAAEISDQAIVEAVAAARSE